jgi:DNA-binding FrmR family transcriptional regulator
VDIDQTTTQVLNRRLRRAAGQLHGVIGMLESGRDCEAILTQLAAVSHAVHRAAYLAVADQLRQCATTRTGDDRAATIAEVEQAFLGLG